MPFGQGHRSEQLGFLLCPPTVIRRHCWNGARPWGAFLGTKSLCPLPSICRRASASEGFPEFQRTKLIREVRKWKTKENRQAKPNSNSSVQSLSDVRLCNSMNHSMPGLPVHHQLPKFTQTHVHRVGDTIQPSHPLSSLSPPALNLSQHQGLFQWVNSLHQVAKVLEFQLQHQSFQWTPRTDLL